MKNLQSVLDRIREKSAKIIHPVHYAQCLDAGHTLIYYAANKTAPILYVCAHCGWSKMPFHAIDPKSLNLDKVYSRAYGDFYWAKMEINPTDEDDGTDDDDIDDSLNNPSSFCLADLELKSQNENLSCP